MTIKVYSSIMPVEPEEVYHDHGLTVEQWVKSKTDNYQRGDCQPISCMINGAIVKPMDWADALIRESDVVEFRPVPRGDVFSGVLGAIFPLFAVSAFAFDAITGFLTPDIPGASGPGQQGQQLDPADARANQARLGSGIPELFGTYIRYPDYVNQPHRYYKDTRTQALNLMLSIGVGEFEIDPSNVAIGETPISELEGVTYQIFEPGEDVSGVDNHENWYNAPEVGATQSSAGIRLSGITQSERTYNGTANTSGQTISGISVGQYWGASTTGLIKITQTVQIVENIDPGPSDTIIGQFQHLEVGQTVDVVLTTPSDSLNGQYVVESLNVTKTELTLETTTGDPVNGLTADTGTIQIDKSDTKYRITLINSSSSIDVERALFSGPVDPEWSQLPTLTGADISIDWDATTMTGFQAGPFAACPDGETTDKIEVDIFAPQGLGVIDGESIDQRTRPIRIEWREIGQASWTVQDQNVSGASRDQLGWTFVVNLPSSIRPEVRVSRLGAESVATTNLDRLELTGLKARLPTVTSYQGVTTMAVTIEGSDEIGRSSENRINLIPQRKLPPVAGGTETTTRSIARPAVYVARTLGYEDDQIDIDEFDRLDTLLEGRGDTFDYVFSDGTALDAMKTIMRAGFADLTIDTGVIKPVRDEPRTTFEQGYSPENMTAPLRRQFTGRQPDESDGVEVEYTDANTWTKETVLCLLPGDQQIKLDKVKLDGITDRTRAWRIGMRRRRAQRYRRWTYNFNTELDALNSEYLSYVPLLDDIPGYGKVAILESISADRIVVSEPLEWQEGKTHVVSYRDENGDVVGPFTATEGPDEYTALVAIPEPWPSVMPGDREPTHIYFGTTERWNFPALISEIRPSGPLEVGVTATNYDERVYSDDDNAPD